MKQVEIILHVTTKINYKIQTESIKDNIIIPNDIKGKEINLVYANEADILNIALFSLTAKEWRNNNPELKGNISDYATINELICLSNFKKF